MEETKEKIAVTFNVKRENLVRLQTYTRFSGKDIDSYLDQMMERHFYLLNTYVMEKEQLDEFQGIFLDAASQVLDRMQEQVDSEEDWKVRRAFADLFSHVLADELLLMQLYKVYKN